jgi:Aminotransferase class I and II
VVIEDDYDGEFRYDRQPVGALQTLAPDHVIYAGTASKSLAPGLRLGWLVVPPRLLDGVAAELAAGPSALDQLTLAEFLISGGYDRQIRRARLAYRSRRDRLAAALNRQGLRVTGIAAGLQAVVEFSRTNLERAVITRASQHGVAVDGLERYRAGAAADDGRAGLVIGYSRPPGHAYTTALARLCAALPAEPEGPAATTRLLPLPYPRGPGEPRPSASPYRGCAARSARPPRWRPGGPRPRIVSGSLSGRPLVSSPGSWVQAGEGGNHCGGRRADSDAPAAGIRHRGGRAGHDPRRRGDHRGRGYLRVRGRAGVRAQDLLAASAHAQEPPRPPHAA